MPREKKQKGKIVSVGESSRLQRMLGSPLTQKIVSKDFSGAKNILDRGIYLCRFTSLVWNDEVSKNLKKALKVFSEISKDDPWFVFSLFWQGKVLFELRDYVGARKIFNKALKLDPTNIYFPHWLSSIEKRLQVQKKLGVKKEREIPRFNSVEENRPNDREIQIPKDRKAYDGIIRKIVDKPESLKFSENRLQEEIKYGVKEAVKFYDNAEKSMPQESKTAVIEPVRHPGEIIREDLIDAAGISVEEAAEKIGLSKVYMYQVLGGQRSISKNVAVGLSKLFDEYSGKIGKRYTVKDLLTMQMNYDLEHLEIDPRLVK